MATQGIRLSLGVAPLLALAFLCGSLPFCRRISPCNFLLRGVARCATESTVWRQNDMGNWPSLAK